MNKANEPAFPGNISNQITHAPGLNKREYFAAMAMQGFCSMPYSDCEEADATGANIARWATVHADALLAELEKG